MKPATMAYVAIRSNPLRLKEEHRVLAERLATLVEWREEAGENPEVIAALDALCTDLLRHSDEEEAHLFTVAEERLDARLLARLQSKRFECSCCGG